MQHNSIRPRKQPLISNTMVFISDMSSVCNLNFEAIVFVSNGAISVLFLLLFECRHTTCILNIQFCKVLIDS